MGSGTPSPSFTFGTFCAAMPLLLLQIVCKKDCMSTQSLRYVPFRAQDQTEPTR